MSYMKDSTRTALGWAIYADDEVAGQTITTGN
ncbi:MAG: hypothetical protein ACJA0H_001686 [Francisellaceae bacterium]|jgi:hypothetical protein